jgi:hypothetical protein
MQWISMAVIFVAAFFFGVMARRSPKKNWDFIKQGPVYALLVMSGVLSQMEASQNAAERFRAEYPPPRTVCETVINDMGIAMEKCDLIVERVEIEEPSPYAGLREWGKGMLISMLLDGPIEFLGIALGMRSWQRALDSP